MSRLLDYLAVDAARSEHAAVKTQNDAAVALAYVRQEHDNQALVDTAIAALGDGQDNPAPIITMNFVAALAALPSETRSQSMSQLQSTINSNRKLAARAGWSNLKRRMMDASRRVDLARAGANNIDGIAAGTMVDPKDFPALARAFAAQAEHEGICIVRRWKNRWFRWSGSAYNELDDEILHGLIYIFLASLSIATGNGPRPLKPNKQLVDYVLHVLAPLVQVPGSSPTRWLDDDQRDRPAIDRCVFCANGTLAIDSWLAGTDGAFIAPTPALFVLKTLAMPFRPAATAPGFDTFVDDIFDADAARKMALRILFGYWLTSSTSLQIIVIFSGLPQTGKGTLMTIMQGVLGVACTNPSFEQLGGPFGLEDLVGANLAILSDVHDTGGNAKSAVEKLLKISGEDAVDIPRKHKSALNGVHLLARFILAMNELVSMPDVSGALSRRLVVLSFLHSFIGKGRAGMAKDIIATEGPGVLMWALEGLRVLQHLLSDADAKGLPTKDTVIAHLRTAASAADHEMLDDLSNPVRVFIRERCEVRPDYTIELDVLYGEWDSWALDNGHHKRSKIRFTADLQAASKGTVSSSQRSSLGSSRVRMLTGISTLHERRLDATFASANASYPHSFASAPVAVPVGTVPAPTKATA